MRATSLLRLLLAVLLAVTLVAACGGDDDDESTASTTSTAADDESTTETSEATDDSTDTSTDDSTDTSTDDSTDTSTDATFTGDADSEWCGLYQQLQDLPDPLEGEGTPEESAELFQQAIGLGQELEDSAPDDIADATAQVNTALQQFDEVLARYDYDFERFGEEGTEEEFALFSSAELQQASDDVTAYASQVCGID
jgi:hypothetical protein